LLAGHLRDAERRLRAAEADYGEIVEHNMRILVWLKRRGLALPGTGELREQVPLSEQWNRMRAGEKKNAGR